MPSLEERVSEQEKIVRTHKRKTAALTALSSASFDNLHNHIDALRADTDKRFEAVDTRFDAMEPKFEKRFDVLEADTAAILKILAEHFKKSSCDDRQCSVAGG